MNSSTSQKATPIPSMPSAPYREAKGSLVDGPMSRLRGKSASGMPYRFAVSDYREIETGVFINHQLRDGIPLKDDQKDSFEESDWWPEEIHNTMLEIAQGSRASSSIEVHRGVSHFPEVKEGQDIESPHWFSCTTSRKFAIQFSGDDSLNLGERPDKMRPVVFRVSVPEGTQIIDTKSTDASEEVIIPPGTRYRVDSIEERDGRREIALSVVDQDVPAPKWEHKDEYIPW